MLVSNEWWNYNYVFSIWNKTYLALSVGYFLFRCRHGTQIHRPQDTREEKDKRRILFDIKNVPFEASLMRYTAEATTSMTDCGLWRQFKIRGMLKHVTLLLLTAIINVTAGDSWGKTPAVTSLTGLVLFLLTSTATSVISCFWFPPLKVNLQITGQWHTMHTTHHSNMDRDMDRGHGQNMRVKNNDRVK